MLEISENQFYQFHLCSQLASHSEATQLPIGKAYSWLITKGIIYFHPCPNLTHNSFPIRGLIDNALSSISTLVKKG